MQADRPHLDRKVRPASEIGCYTQMHHAYIDSVMPLLSPSAWKIFCVILRQTKGYNRENARASYAQIREACGVGSDATIKAAIYELLTFDPIAGRIDKPKTESFGMSAVKADEHSHALIRVEGGSRLEACQYGINFDLEMVWQPRDFEFETAGNEADTATVIVEADAELDAQPSTIIVEGADCSTTEIVEPPTTIIVEPPENRTTKIVESYRKKEILLEKEIVKDISGADAPADDSPAKRPKPRKKTDRPTGKSETAYPLGRWYGSYCAAHVETEQMPYLRSEAEKGADFAQLKALLQKCDANAWPMTEEKFQQALTHYFASPVATRTFADFCVRFSTFWRSALNQYKTPTKYATTAALANGNNPKTAGNAAVIAAFVEKMGGTR